ncbi:MAG: hypothetical protein JSW47_05865 [Phycisphaerales bacterium]|nr:MAG: hypothetical protein JSW47_05865 [Phycisphaerales bacterium]
METLRTVGLLLLVLCACLIGGCAGSRGIVLVGQPEVFTRERLIDGRYEDYEWLRGKLEDADDAVGFQGFVDRKILDITIAKVVAEYKMDLPGDSVTSTTTDKASQKTDPNKADESAPTPGGSSAPSVASEPRLRKEANATYREIPSGKQADRTEAEITKIDQLNDQLAYRSAVRAAMRQSMVDDSHDLTGGMLYDLKFDVTIVPGDNSRRNAVVLFTINEDQYNDDKKKKEQRIRRHEYVKWVGSVEREINELSLSLQQKLLRGTLSSTDTRWSTRAVQAIADARDKLPKLLNLEARLRTGEEVRELKKQIRQLRAVQTLLEALGEPQAYDLNGKVMPVGKERLDPVAILEDAARMLSSVDLRLMSTAEIARIKPSDPNYRSRINVQTATMWALAQGVVNFYERGLTFFGENSRIGDHPLLDFRANEPVQQQSIWYVYVKQNDPCKVDPNGRSSIEHMEIILRHLEKRYGRDRAVVVDTQPKEYAQNVSDVGAGRYIFNFLAAFSGSAASKLELGAEYERFLDEQIMLQAIQRRALAIGFNNSSNQFGYILGPQFEIEKNERTKGIKPVYKHRATRQTVGATMIAPVWRRNVTLSYKTYWVNAPGKLVPCKPSGPDVPDGSGSVKVTLPWDYVALTRAVMYGASVESLKPTLYDTAWSAAADDSNEHKPTYQLTAGQAGELLIRGMELWRNPQVFVGSQRADQVTVLANMDSLHAQFDEVRWPGGPTSKPRNANLTVITSYGTAVLDNATEILPPEKKPKQPALVLDERGWTLKDNADNFFDIAFKVAEPLPESYAGLRIDLREAATITGFEVMKKGKINRPNTDEIVFQIDVDDQDPKVQNNLFNKTKALEVRPMLKLRPDAEFEPIKLGERRHLVYFNSNNDQKIQVLDVKNNTVTIKSDDSVTPSSAKLKLPANISLQLFEQYVPDFIAAAKRGDVELVLTPEGRPPCKIQCSRLVGDTMTVNLKAATQALIDGERDEAGETDVTLTLSVGDKPRLTITKWKLKWDKKKKD